MPPYSSGSIPANANANAAHSQLESRNMGGINTSTAPSLSSSQEKILQILVCTFSAVSVTSAIVAFLWFIKIRRSFRHDLVMLLIQSDMFKALWFMIYPIVVLTRGPVPNNSTFCQASGFFLALGIEASDLAALMIAIHTALYIFRPKTSGREGGLFPYRHIAYTLWIILPVLSASLAFVNQGEGYVSEGTYCYLPVRPFWYRLALTWIPRYIIFVVILGIYASIYYYVRYKFNDFSNQPGANPGTFNSETSAGERPRSVRRATVPPTLRLVSHGPIQDSRQNSVVDNNARKLSVSTIGSADPPNASRVAAHRFIWGSFSVEKGAFPPRPPSEASNADADSFTGPSIPRPIPSTTPQTITPRSQESDDSITAAASRGTSWRDVFFHWFSPNMSGNPSSTSSVVGMFSILRHHPDSSNNPSPISQLQLINARGQTFAAAEMLQIRDKIRRQLRILFIYPLVYIGLWILPFVSHVLQYDDNLATDPPFGLSVVTTICICSQAAVDSWLFSTREKPWQHIPGTGGSFWASLKFWSGWAGLRKRDRAHGPGKSREEMVREAREAYQRRDVELAYRRNVSDSLSAPEVARRRERSWWEVTSSDGMSPVSEEESNPMERRAMISPPSEGKSPD